jgi:hypothetical protein
LRAEANRLTSPTSAKMTSALADSNVAARQARALALAGLAGATGDPARATEAVEAFTHAQAIISAKSVAADTQRLLPTITAHDQTGVLAELSGAPGPVIGVKNEPA